MSDQKKIREFGFGSQLHGDTDMILALLLPVFTDCSAACQTADQTKENARGAPSFWLRLRNLSFGLGVLTKSKDSDKLQRCHGTKFSPGENLVQKKRSMFLRTVLSGSGLVKTLKPYLFPNFTAQVLKCTYTLTHSENDQNMTAIKRGERKRWKKGRGGMWGRGPR